MMPRTCGIRCGTKVRAIPSAPAAANPWAISGVCRWRGQAVRLRAALELGVEEVGSGAPPGSRDAGLGIDDDVAGEQAGPRERRQGEERGGRVAAGIGDELRAGQPVARELGQAVDRTGRGRRAPDARIRTTRDRRVGRSSRRSEPMSITVVPPLASSTASSADWPCGRARKATSTSPGSGRPSTSVSPSGARCGNSSASGVSDRDHARRARRSARRGAARAAARARRRRSRRHRRRRRRWGSSRRSGCTRCCIDHASRNHGHAPR